MTETSASRANFEGLEVVAFESRHAEEMAALITNSAEYRAWLRPCVRRRWRKTPPPWRLARRSSRGGLTP